MRREGANPIVPRMPIGDDEEEEDGLPTNHRG